MTCYREKSRSFVIFSVFLAFAAKTVLASDVDESFFKGPKAVSPKLIVSLFGPWISDSYPNLVRSADLMAVDSNKNRLFCRTLSTEPDGSVKCTDDGEVLTYTYLGKIGNKTYAFKTIEASEKGTFAGVTYRFFEIINSKSASHDGKTQVLKLLTLIRDYPITSGTNSEHQINKESNSIEITSQTNVSPKSVVTLVFE